MVSNPERKLAILLRVIGSVDLCAVVAVFLPVAWMDAAHQWLGLGPLPKGAIVDYLARSASSLYAVHGALMWYAATDVRRYRRLIRFMAFVALAHGSVIVGIDFHAVMPRLWTLIEGTAYFAPAIAVLWMLDRAKFEQQPSSREPR